MARTSPTVRRRRLGQELRSLREMNGMTAEQVAKELDWSPSKVSRIETTAIKVGTVDLRALLDVYGVVDKARRDGLLELGRESRETAWWMRVQDRTPVRGFKDFIGFEAEARRIRTYEPSIVPGLLQTEDYARAMLRVMRTADVDLDEAVKQRLERQQILVRSDDPVFYTALIDEAALRRPIGGKIRVTVMRDQIDKLLELSDVENIEILVVPFEAGGHPGMGGAFTVLDLPHPDDPNIVYVEAITDAMLLSDDKSVRYYNDVLDGVRSEAWGFDRSAEFLRALRDEYAAKVR
ncbi:helix-turn-helix domain-containing protein [Cryptosporangium minutisporangium]|uniref:helix-turn-helix domain-containing protein n=1 Tax=Cryptosporangium minutisporangium TaxID=113569 RepID=UPI0035EC6358